MDEPVTDGGREALSGSVLSEPGKPLVPAGAASPRLDGELFTRLLSYGTPQETREGDVLFEPGDEDVDLIVVVRARSRSSGRRPPRCLPRPWRRWPRAASWAS